MFRSISSRASSAATPATWRRCNCWAIPTPNGVVSTRAWAWTNGSRNWSPDNPLVFYNLACSYSLTDQCELAARALEQAFQLGYRDFAWLARDPDLRKLRKHPLYTQIRATIRRLKANAT